MRQHMIDLNSFFLTYRREDVKAHFFKGGMKRLYFFNHSFLLDFVGTTDTINVQDKNTDVQKPPFLSSTTTLFFVRAIDERYEQVK
ncbi:hypothetical protein BSK33_08290 [Geobacillus sp. 44B]|nr:hypothetical protein BSK33_08290 [Geobacillus sp. 44B]